MKFLHAVKITKLKKEYSVVHFFSLCINGNEAQRVSNISLAVKLFDLITDIVDFIFIEINNRYKHYDLTHCPSTKTTTLGCKCKNEAGN